MSFNKLKSKIVIKIIFTLIILKISEANNSAINDWSDFERTTPQLIESRNFKSETHFITTSDGYILQIFRIINPFLNKKKQLKPIILQHGFCGDSDEFLISRKGYLTKDGQYIEDGQTITDCTYNKKLGKTLGFVLSACGYDVWLSNVRGNRYTQNHTTFDPGSFKFWKFSLDEMSLIDLPAIINYIGVRTQNQRIGFISYSIGTTLMFALMSTKPEYSSLIEPFVAIAPMVFVSNCNFVRFTYLYPLFRALPIPLIRSYRLRKLVLKVFNRQLQYEDSDVSEMSNHMSGRTSSLVVAHLIQLMANKNFARFNWGLFENIIRYGSSKPPEYPLRNITSNKIALIQTKDDVFSDYKDIQRLKNELSVKLLLDYWIPDKNWTHSDYLFNKNTDIYVNAIIINLLKS